MAEQRVQAARPRKPLYLAWLLARQLGQSVPNQVPPEDPSALSNAIAAVLDDLNEETRRRRVNAVEAEQEFGVRKWVERIEGVYRGVSGERVSPTVE